MLQKRAANGNGIKRKAIPPPDSPRKGPKNGITLYNESPKEEAYGIVQREFYPPEMTNARCHQYNNNELPRPIELLEAAQEDTKEARENIPVKDAVVHWYKCDLRTRDNKALHLAHRKARSKGVPLICMYIVSPQDFQAHLTSPVRVDFILRTLAVLKEDLAELGIPLHVKLIEKRKTIPDKIIEWCEKWGASHIYANAEYEVDELRREAMMTRKCLDKGISMTVVPDTCVVAPGELSSQQGRQYAVYSPWFRAWVAYLHQHPHQLDPYERPGQNPSSAHEKFKDIFEGKIPEAPENKKLNDEEKKRFHSMWPAGEQEALARLEMFLDQKIGKYKDSRNFPASNGTACTSVHFASGTLAARTAIRRARDVNSTTQLDKGNLDIASWISEVAWRDFYKHVLAHWPYICMNKPFKPEYTNIAWEYSPTLFHAWTTGHTGYPIVDAAMRQLNTTGYMHNRCRMITASFLAKHLLLDWRLGEIYFMEHLIDGDWASNNGGWGFSASSGVDPQPYFRIFNPLLQSEKFDAAGEYIRKWVPELREVPGKAVHDPYARGAAKVAEKEGYPRMVVEHRVARERCLERYKAGLGRGTA